MVFKSHQFPPSSAAGRDAWSLSTAGNTPGLMRPRNAGRVTLPTPGGLASNASNTSGPRDDMYHKHAYLNTVHDITALVNTVHDTTALVTGTTRRKSLRINRSYFI